MYYPFHDLGNSIKFVDEVFGWVMIIELKYLFLLNFSLFNSLN